MDPSDERFIRQTLAMALGVVIMMPKTDTKSEMVERLKRSIEKLDACPTIEAIHKMIAPSRDPHFGVPT